MTDGAAMRHTGRWTGRALGLTLAVAVAATGMVGVQALESAPVYAIDANLPSWDDVQRAKQDEGATAAKVTEIEGLLVQLEAQVEQTRNRSAAAAAAFKAADESFQAAAVRSASLDQQAAESQQAAEIATEQAASLVSQMYRSGGMDRSVELFLETDGSTADQLLERLSTMSKAAERNTVIADEAEQTMNTAQTLGEQAAAARNERDRLRTIAEEEKATAAAAAEAARLDLEREEAQKAELQSQLAALKDVTTQTVQGYQERLRQEEAERQRIQAEIARQQEEARRAAAAAPQPGGGGGGGNPAPPVSSGGWGVPVGGYWVSDDWGANRNHLGIDLAVGPGTPIRAAGSGTVTFSGWWPYCGGYQVEISHGGGFQTWYSHMIGPPIVGNGQWVGVGQVIGYVGSTGCSTGPHLHFATLQNGQFVPPRGVMAQRGVYF